MVNNASDSTWRASIAGSYGNFIYDHIVNINRPFYFLDFGANQGVFSLVAARNPHCRRVFAFEPNADTFGLLVSNIRLSPDPSKILPFCGAVVDGPTRPVEMQVPLKHSGAASISRQWNAREARSVMTIGIGSSLLGELCTIPENVEVHAKVDVEGAELIVFEALKASAVMDRITSLTVEVSEHVVGQGHAHAITDLLSSVGFHLMRRSNESTHYDGIFTRRPD